ncbi:MAG: SEC-C metal-binding domain-containing protein, partial [Solirubrobacterales bacterium]
LEGVIERLVDEYTAGDILDEWDLGELETQLRQIWPVSIEVGSLAPETVDRDQLKEALDDDAMNAYDEREEQLGEELMRYLERSILLQVIDNRWREHLFDMDYLREGIHLRGFAQIDPLVAYKNEGFTMFRELMASIWEEFARVIFHVEVNIEPAQAAEMFGAEEEDGGGAREMQYAGGGPEQPSAMRQAASGGAAGMGAAVPGVTGGGGVGPSPPTGGAGNGGGDQINPGTVVKDDREKIGRNDPCWCGSGKKYKKCHGA